MRRFKILCILRLRPMLGSWFRSIWRNILFVSALLVSLFALVAKFALTVFPEVEADVRVMGEAAVLTGALLFHEITTDARV